MIERLSTNIAHFIRDNNKEAASLEVLMFTITIVLNTILVTMTVLGISAVNGRFAEAALLLSSYLFLRYFTGGVHLPTAKMCIIFSIILLTILANLPIIFSNTGFILNSLAFLVVTIFSPTKDIMHLNRLGPKYTYHFKIISMAIVGVNFWIQSPILALAFFTQSLSLTPGAYKLVAKIERR